MIENNDQLIDIYDIWYQPFYRQGWFYNIVILCILFSFLFLIYLFYKKFIKKIKKIDCSVIAYQELDQLKNFQIVSKQDSKDCYFKISLIIKRYLACRFHKNFSQCTDKEIMVQVQNCMSDADIRLLDRILQGMTFLKFEHQVAMTEKLEKDVELIKEFIERTTQLGDTKGF